MKRNELKKIVEAALMAVAKPLSVDNLLAMFGDDLKKPDRNEVRKVINELQEDYAGRGVELKEVASGFRFQAPADVAEWINRVFDEKPQRYSPALLETLAIIVYRQPVTRGEIEDIRGVGVSPNIIRTLLGREWIKVVGHRDVPGRPELLATTKQFLDYFNLKQLSELPPLSEIEDLEQVEPDLFDSPDQDTVIEIQPAQQQRPEEEPDAGMDDAIFEEGNVVPFSGQPNTS